MNLQTKSFPELSQDQQTTSTTTTRAVTPLSNTSSGAVTPNTLEPEQ